MRALTRALEINPNHADAHIEYGNGLYMLYCDRRVDDASNLYQQATEFTPRDAVEKLDVESALAEFE